MTDGEDRNAAWIDVSVPLRSGMAHWPDNPPVRIERVMDIERGDAANVSEISLGAHTGTHMDAPPSTSSGAARAWTKCPSTPPSDARGSSR